MDPTLLTVAEAGRAIVEGRLSPIAMTEAYLERIDALDDELHSYVTVLHEAARTAARESAAGRSRGPLHGIPIGLKDIYKTNGIRTTAGSRRYEHHVPEEDAESWVRLRDAGAILLGTHAAQADDARQEPKVCRLAAGGKWIRKFSSALPLVVARVSEIRDLGGAAGRIGVRSLDCRRERIRTPAGSRRSCLREGSG